jgi:hypothetical protein
MVSIGLLSLEAQTHTSVPLNHEAYYLLEQAQIRGLCAPLPGAKPYSRAQVLSAINEILSADAEGRFGGLTEQERRILENARKPLTPPPRGLDWRRGAFYAEHIWDWARFSADIGFTAEHLFSGGGYPGDQFAWATEHWFTVYLKGDLGERISYGFTVSGGIMRTPRKELGTYNTYYPGFVDEDAPVNAGDDPTSYVNREITSYSEPLAYFPYAYKKRWDAFVFNFTQIDNSGGVAWPQEPSIGYAMFPELSGAILNGHLTYRFARLDREWAGMERGSSLVLNQMAQPFVGLETAVRPFSWLAFSSLTGGLEYYDAEGVKISSESSQNLFSIAMLEFNYKNYAHFDAGSTVLWPKRFELGYLFPVADNFFYQNNIGDFDNTGLFFNLRGQYPGLGKVWFSFFLDEINPEKNIFELDRAMYALQAGVGFSIPILSFTSVTISYTKIEPYCYTHTRVFVPWYGDIRMEAAYVNNGKSLGSYLPPNSDELLFRFETVPAMYTKVAFQYQMIRHGADYGSSAVDGSSLLSELDPSGRSEKPVLRKYFLQDGAYQWMHILKVGGEYSLYGYGAPLKLFAEAGVVFSYFTNIEGQANSGEPSAYSVIDTSEYPHSTGIIFTLGVKAFIQ